MTLFPSSYATISTVAATVGDSEDNIQGFIRDDRIPYIYSPEGVLISWGGFRTCMPDLYDLEEDLERLGR